MGKKEIETSKVPWVFWLRISIRRKWFSNYWATRGANFFEMQLWIFRISIGRPWIQNAVYQKRKNYNSLDSLYETNGMNKKQMFSFQVGKTPKRKSATHSVNS